MLPEKAQAERAQWEAAIQAAWDDDTLRAIYADWLEEHGEPGAAQEMRDWPKRREAARAYVEELADAIGGPPPEGEDSYGYHEMSADELLAAAALFLETGEYEFRGADERYDEHYDEFRGDFWEHYYVLTGKKAGDDQKRAFFRCAC